MCRESYTQRAYKSTEQQPEGSPPPAALPGVGGDSLVNRSISEQSSNCRNPVKSFLVYHRAVKLVRDFTPKDKPTPPVNRGEIQSFSDKSRRRLKFAASNAFPSLVSQLALTYHHGTPDGLTVKRHLHAFLVAMRRKFPGVGYLWILEFQKRGVPHFHLFLTMEHAAAVGVELGMIWNRIAEPDSPQHLRWHTNGKNFIPWDMGSGAYLCKYLDKEAQKAVPEGFSGVGRFWGSSRGLVPDPDEITTEDLSEVCGAYAVAHMVRTVCKCHESTRRRSKWKKRPRLAHTSATLPTGATVVRRLLQSYETESPVAPPPF